MGVESKEGVEGEFGRRVCKAEQGEVIEGKEGVEGEHRIILVKACAHSD